ncbi:spore germination protein [Heliobacterium chlorum]|uniref:Spore germination protein n=1 Tax=Heliobacterium chlorum TaxID=2698 RepID=A0ABR7T2I4_HELCL|nr:spore germination protein [Heliobacterium chlorum]MBC9784861.1 spore germination protein [Heliobacterium chlorum]
MDERDRAQGAGASHKVKEPEFSEAKISDDLQTNLMQIDSELGVNVGFDVGCRKMDLAGRKAALYYVNGFTKDLDMLQIMRSLDDFEKDAKEKEQFIIDRLVDRYLFYLQVTKESKVRQIYYHILSGRIAILFDGEKEAVIVEARQMPARQPEEPDIERVVRGSRDGFTETIVTNTALIRRRIRDPRLRFKLTQVGRRSQTDVCIAYIEDIADPHLIDEIMERVNSIDIDGLPMAEKTLEEFITGNDWNPYPRVRYTERPDVAAQHLLEGHVLVMCDTSPSVMIAPVTVFHHLEHAEEYRQNPPVGIYLRIVRYAAIFASLFVLPLWVLVTLNPTLLPPGLAFIGPKKMGNVPILAQVLIAEFGLDMLRMAAIHTPTPLATALGLIAAFMIGEVAINVGLFNPEIILYLAVAAVGSFATPSYELGQANRLVRLFLILMTAAFSWIGLLIGILAFLVLVIRTRSFGKPYFWPLAPINAKMIPVALLRAPVPAKRLRPQILDPIDYDRLPDAYAGAAGGTAQGTPQTRKNQQGKGQKPSKTEREKVNKVKKNDSKVIPMIGASKKEAPNQDNEQSLGSPRWRHHRRGLWTWFKTKMGGKKR